MKIALIGQDIPMMLPSILADCYFSEKEPVEIVILEKNPAMQSVLCKYGAAIAKHSGLTGAEVTTSDEISEVLMGADGIIYANDCQPASRFKMDREALSGVEEDDPGLSDQARVNGGIGGLLHTLRVGDMILGLCEDIHKHCPRALVVNLSQPVARTTEIFENEGIRCLGLGESPLRHPGGLYALCKKMGRKSETVKADIAGVPGFEFLLSLKDTATRQDLLPQLETRCENGELGRLVARWYDWYGAFAVGNIIGHAEFLPAEPDFAPDEEPSFGESVEQRKERILHMNKVGEFGADSTEGAIAQITLLSKAPALRPMKLAVCALARRDISMEAVTRRNDGDIADFSNRYYISAPYEQKDGALVAHKLVLPDDLIEISAEIAETNHLAALAAAGDRSALRECIEIDPALCGLDRLYCCDVVDKMIELHSDVIHRL